MRRRGATPWGKNIKKGREVFFQTIFVWGGLKAKIEVTLKNNLPTAREWRPGKRGDRLKKIRMEFGEGQKNEGFKKNHNAREEKRVPRSGDDDKSMR